MKKKLIKIGLAIIISASFIALGLLFNYNAAPWYIKPFFMVIMPALISILLLTKEKKTKKI